jgi:hypothetical protein
MAIQPLPDGGRDQTRIRVASVVSFLVMKGMALHGRLKEKDAWDIYFTVTNYPGGLDELTEVIGPHMGHALVAEGLVKIAENFASPEHMGTKFAADFDERQDPDERAMRRRDVYERISYSSRALGVPRS